MPDRDAFLFINLWADKAGEVTSVAFKKREQAIEEIAADYDHLRYIGTVIVDREGIRSPEDWSDDARQHRKDATEDWLHEQRERQAHRQKVL